MRLRWKFFFALFGFSLVPMLVLTGFNRKHVEKLGHAIAAEGRVLLTDVIKNELKQTAEDYALVMRRSKSAMDFSLTVLAAESERVLFGPAPASRVPEPPSDPAPEAGGIAASLLTGVPSGAATQPRGRPALFHPPGTRPVPARDARLAGLVPTFAMLHDELGDLLLFAAVTLEDGTHVTFPGRSDYPADYDPRERPWYQAAKAAFDPARPGSGPVIWNDPGVDAASGRVTLTLSKALVGPGRRFVGVVSLDVPLTRVLQDQEIVSQWSEAMRTFLVAPMRDPDTDEPSLYVWAQRSTEAAAPDWKSTVNFDRLTSSDAAAFAALVRTMERERSGVAELPYNGGEAIWAYARLVNNAALLLIAPKAAILSPLADQTSHEILAATGDIVRLSGGSMLVVLLAVTVAAILSTKAVVRPLVKIIEAWKRLANGDFSVRLDLHIGDERQSLIDAFNETVPVLADHVRLQRSMELAQEVQRSLLPAAPPEVPGLDVAGVSLPCDETGGDYFEYRAVTRGDETCLDTAVGDVTGHGVPSALLMATARALLLATEDNETPAQRVRRANRLLARDVGDSGRFMTLLAVEIWPQTGQARYVRAGHDPAILYDPRADAFTEWPGSGVPLGIMPEYPYKENRMPFDQPGLVLALGTDGIWEARDPAGEMYGKERFRNVLRRNAGRPAAAIVAAVIDDLDNFRANRRPEDDVTLVVIKRETIDGERPPAEA